jgi:hypothetical protein
MIEDSSDILGAFIPLKGLYKNFNAKYDLINYYTKGKYYSTYSVNLVDPIIFKGPIIYICKYQISPKLKLQLFYFQMS